MSENHEFGRACEDVAALDLERRGWQILTRNFRDGPREIDIVARRSDLVAFVEVKGRADHDHGHPLEAIGHRKRRELAGAARAWIARNGIAGCSYRFDAIAVTRTRSGLVLEHVEDAWRL